MRFQKLNEAFEVLSNPNTRARYDTLYVEAPTRKSLSQRVEIEPIACSCCGQVTAQPRYIIFYEVKSFILVTIRSPTQGIFCHNCAEKKLLRSTIVTWVLGWWGFPWGIFYSLITIFNNLFGGYKPNEANARLLAYQFWFFATQNKLALARAVAADANNAARKIKSNQGMQLQTMTGDLLTALETKTPIKRLQNAWSIPNRLFYWQSGILTIVVTFILSLIFLASQVTMMLDITILTLESCSVQSNLILRNYKRWKAFNLVNLP